MVKNKRIATGLALLLALIACTALRAQEPDQITVEFLAGAHPQLHAPDRAIMGRTGALTTAGKPQVTAAAGIPGIDSISNFNGSYVADGYDPSGNPNNHWLYNMAGTPPDSGTTTVFNAPIIPVSLDLRDANGHRRYVNGHRLYSDATQFVRPVLKSPVFQKARYGSSEKRTQFADAVQRAEFGDEAEDDWHTLLDPAVKTPRVMRLNQGTYRFALNSDGSCCLFVLIDYNVLVSALFPPTYPVDSSTPIGAAEVAGDITTKDISTFLFPNAYLYLNGDPNQCCLLGFHGLDFEPGIPSNGNLNRFYVLNYSSWISPGIWGGGDEDVTALSHEMAETFNDPFVAFDGVHNVTPWWSSGGLCADILEVGDAIEGLPNATYPITMHGYTYHPQNEALLPWFEFKSPSTADHRAYSFPDETVLTALSPLEKVGCAP